MNLSRETLQQMGWVFSALGISFAFVNFFIQQFVPVGLVITMFLVGAAFNRAYERRCQWDAREVP